MDAKMATKSTIHDRLGRQPVPAKHNYYINRSVCKYWLAGKCSRNPCKFMHTEVRAPNKVYRRPDYQSNAVLEEVKKHKKSFSCGPNNSLALSHQTRSISDHVNKNLPGKHNSLALSHQTGSVSDHVNKDLLGKQNNMKTNIVSTTVSGASEDISVKETTEKACVQWMSGTCAKGDGCQFLHTWFCGDWFSMLAKLQGHTQAVSGVALPANSDKLYSGSSDGTVRVWDCHTGQCTRVITLADKIGSVISEGPWIFVGLPNVIKAWNLETMTDFSLDTPKPCGQIYDMAVGQNMLFAGTQDGSIFVWEGSAENSKSFQLATSLKGHASAVVCLIVGENRLYSGSIDGTIRAWDLTTLQCVHTLNGHTDAVTSLICWEEYLISCSLDRTVKVWALGVDGNLQVVYTHSEKHGAVTLCGLYDSEAKPILLCSYNDNTVHLYELPSFNLRGKIFSKQEVRTIAAGPSGLFFTGDGTGAVSVWNLTEQGKKIS
ncbi:zinc finger CCCH domain-containing protein 48-like [Mercurialis annua]|uniref:zinc finger CCCH domain-containing protein 48-like n=1 Tax=Mercurialis annua TaxID=3986 RepID=UPI00215E2EA0|nr:zinc finger CCCH domain-containing protein 48-like [Mercurialis annua]XP_050218806.1 zinc finger CCCH domain-containing protein 48-like [Mercurialis annua]